MATPYSNSYNDTMPFSDTVVQIQMDASSELTYTVPGTSANRYVAIFSTIPTQSVWVALNSTASLPLAHTVVTSSRNIRNPDKKYLSGGDVLHFITPTANGVIGFELFSLPNPV